MADDRIVATYLIENPLNLEQAAQKIAGVQSSSTFVAVPGVGGAPGRCRVARWHGRALPGAAVPCRGYAGGGGRRGAPHPRHHRQPARGPLAAGDRRDGADVGGGRYRLRRGRRDPGRLSALTARGAGVGGHARGERAPTAPAGSRRSPSTSATRSAPCCATTTPSSSTAARACWSASTAWAGGRHGAAAPQPGPHPRPSQRLGLVDASPVPGHRLRRLPEDLAPRRRLPAPRQGASSSAGSSRHTTSRSDHGAFADR
jgi:hypothetical protein